MYSDLVSLFVFGSAQQPATSVSLASCVSNRKAARVAMLPTVSRACLGCKPPEVPWRPWPVPTSGGIREAEIEVGFEHGEGVRIVTAENTRASLSPVHLPSWRAGAGLETWSGDQA